MKNNYFLLPSDQSPISIDGIVTPDWYVFFVEILHRYRKDKSILDFLEEKEKESIINLLKPSNHVPNIIPFISAHTQVAQNALTLNGMKPEWYTDIQSRLGAKFVDNALYANLSGEAQTFGGFKPQWYQDRLDGTLPVPKSTHAIMADKATVADNAVKADLATMATRATNADDAKTADVALTARDSARANRAKRAALAIKASRLADGNESSTVYWPVFAKNIESMTTDRRVPKTSNHRTLFLTTPWHSRFDPVVPGTTTKKPLPDSGIGIDLDDQGEIWFYANTGGPISNLKFRHTFYTKDDPHGYSGKWLNINTDPSDRNIKIDHPVVSDVFSPFDKIKPVRFEFDKKKTNLKHPDGVLDGFYAQDIQKLYPELVINDNEPGSKNTFLSMNSHAKIHLISVLWRAVQQLIKDRNETRDDVPKIDETHTRTLADARKEAMDLLRVCHSRAIRKATGGDTREQIEAKMMMADVARRDAKGTATTKETKMLTDAAKLAWVRLSRFRSDILKSMDTRNEKIFNLQGKVVSFERDITRAKSISSVDAILGKIPKEVV